MLYLSRNGGSRRFIKPMYPNVGKLWLGSRMRPKKQMRKDPNL